MVSIRTEKAAKNYSGETARQYEAKRVKQPKWQREQEILERIIKGLPGHMHILDCPVGTGRLLPFFAEQTAYDVHAIDISEDMLEIARQKLGQQLPKGMSVAFKKASIFSLPLVDQEVDVTFAIRIMNKIGVQDVPAALKELQRVTRDRIVFNLRVDQGNSRFRHPVPMSTVRASLVDDWIVATTEEIHEPDFRMITLTRVKA